MSSVIRDVKQKYFSYQRVGNDGRPYSLKVMGKKTPSLIELSSYTSPFIYLVNTGFFLCLCQVIRKLVYTCIQLWKSLA